VSHDAVDQRPIGDRIGRIVLGWSEHFDDLDLDRPPSPAAREIKTGIDGQAVDPGVEPISLAKAPQVAPGPEEALLDSIARELVVPEDQASGRVQPRDGRVNELGEGVMIALPRPLDESSLVHGHLGRRRDQDGRVYSLWRRGRSKCSRLLIADLLVRANPRRARRRTDRTGEV